MENLTFTNVLLALLGVTIYLLMKFKNRSNKERFSFKYWLRDNWIDVSLAVTSTVALILFADEIANYYDFKMDVDGKQSPLIKAACFFCGYLNQSIFKNLSKFFKK